MSNKTINEPWLSFFREIDDKIAEDIRLEIIGGFVITENYGSARTTADVDVISISPKASFGRLLELAGEGSILHKKYKVYLDAVGIAPLPENYEDRLREIYPRQFERLQLLALDPYDIALAKIERNIERDRDDVKFLARVVPFDLEILRERYFKELRPVLGNPEREDLTLRLWTEMVEEERNRK